MSPKDIHPFTSKTSNYCLLIYSLESAKQNPNSNLTSKILFRSMKGENIFLVCVTKVACKC